MGISSFAGGAKLCHVDGANGHTPQFLTAKVLHQQTLAFQGSAGTSAENRCYSFVPAFMDTETGKVCVSRYADGRPAPMHLLEGLPEELIVARDAAGRSTAAKHSVIAGFVRDGIFYTRRQAAELVAG